MKLVKANRKKRVPIMASGNTYRAVKTRSSRRIKIPNFLPCMLALFTTFIFVVMISIALLYLYRYVTISEFFALKEIQVAGNVRLGSGEILKMAGLRTGMNNLAVRMGDVETRLLRNPWIAGVSLKRELPDRFFVEVRERVPRYWVRQGDKVAYADAQGRVISEVEPGKFTSLPYLAVDAGMEEWVRQLPDMVGVLETASLPLDVNNAAWVRLSRSRGVELYLENADMILNLAVAEWDVNLARLAAVLEDLKRRGEIRRVREVTVAGSNVWIKEDRPVSAGN